MIGQTVSHYQITEKLGQGGMGVVYKALDTKLDRSVALKFLSTSALPTDDDKARFHREAKAAAKLNHPHIATVYEIDETDDGRAFIAMEYVEGETLSERIKRGPLKLQEAITIATEVAEGLQAAHEQGVVHRDVKSSNVMLTERGQVKVMDFGLAKTEAETMLTKEGTTLGTVAYMSPEQARGGEVDHRTDLWSLGVVLYEMIVGRLPFAADYEQAMIYSILNEDPEALTGLRTGVPMDLERIVNKLLAKEARHRYQTTADLIADLETLDLAATGMSRTSSVSRIEDLRAVPARRRPSWIIPVIMVTTVVIAFLLGRITDSATEHGDGAELRRIPIVLKGLVSAEQPQLSADERYLGVYGIDRNSTAGVYLFDFQAGDLFLVEGTAGESQGGFSISPNGDHIAYGISSGIWVARMPSGVPRQLTDYGLYPKWISEEKVVFSEFDQQKSQGPLWAVNIHEGEPTVHIDTDSTEGLTEFLVGLYKVPGRDHLWTGFQQDRAALDAQRSGVYLYNDATGRSKVFERGPINVRPIPGDRLVFQIGTDFGDIVWQDVDYDKASLVGQTQVVAEKAYFTTWNVTPGGDFLLARTQYDTYHDERVFIVDLQNKTSIPLPSSR